MNKVFIEKGVEIHQEEEWPTTANKDDVKEYGPSSEFDDRPQTSAIWQPPKNELEWKQKQIEEFNRQF